LIDFYSRGIATGVDPEATDRWVRLEEHDQAKVEAASIALVLELTRPWIWDRLSGVTQQRVIAYLEPVVGDDTYPQTKEFNGGFCVLELPSREAAIEWAAKIAESCRCSQELREFHYDPES
jgi:hypothetical protein